MMENREYLNSLFDIYRELLTEVEAYTFESYYMEDLSLSEIADNRGISKSSVGKTLNSGVEKLLNFEEKLKVHSLKQEMENYKNIQQEIACNMLQKGTDIKYISDVTNLSIEEIKKLKKN